jgi:hypothetical protein
MGSVVISAFSVKLRVLCVSVVVNVNQALGHRLRMQEIW